MTGAVTAAAAAAEYDCAKRIARGGTDGDRMRLASQPDTPAELLYFLANDGVLTVRAAVAANPATPPQADSVLAADPDARVRALLGRKLAPLAGGVSAAAQDRLGRLAWQTLSRLAADTVELVRAAIAVELQAMPDAPRELILRLARDAAMTVAEPIIRFSPLLTDDDLLALVAAPPVPATVTAVARRPGLSAAVCDAIVARSDGAAVAALLGNQDAAIRESALDAVIVGAAVQVSWQEGLVARPGLPPATLRALAEMVTEHLLAALAARPDLDAGTAQALRARVAARLAPGPLPPAGTGPTPPAGTGFEDACRSGDRAAMLELLAVAAGVEEAIVARAVRLRSARGLVSLCWQAGFAPRSAMLAQVALGGLSPGEVLTAPPTGWALTPEEMRWQVTLLGEAEG